MTPADLAPAARAELAAREKHYPLQVANNQRSAADAQADFQAWHCIVGWLETGRFTSIVDGDRIVGWKDAEAAAVKAVAWTTRLVDDAGDDDAKAQRVGERLAALAEIARRVAAHKRVIDFVNAEFRRRERARQQGREAA